MNYEEKLVSPQIAKLLKKLGFDVMCPNSYGLDVRYKGKSIDEDKEYELKARGKGEEIEYVECGTLYAFWHKNNPDDPTCAAPTLSMAQKWLREEKHISVEVNHGYGFDCETEGLNAEDSYILFWRFTISNLRMDADDIFHDENEMESFLGHPTYDEALELGILKCLTILANKKND